MPVTAPMHEAPELDHPDVAGHGPSADGDPMGTPAADEKVLWKGRPDTALLARTAFHTRGYAAYFAALIAGSLMFGNGNAAAVCAVLGVVGLAVLQALAWRSAHSTLYILTDQRLIMRIGMAIETRINIPLKHVTAAHLKPRGKGHGDIALELTGEKMLGWLLLWPHNRPLRYARPQPMLRSIPDAHKVAGLLAEACSRHEAIERNVKPQAPVTKPSRGIAKGGLEGAPA